MSVYRGLRIENDALPPLKTSRYTGDVDESEGTPTERAQRTALHQTLCLSGLTEFASLREYTNSFIADGLWLKTFQELTASTNPLRDTIVSKLTYFDRAFMHATHPSKGAEHWERKGDWITMRFALVLAFSPFVKIADAANKEQQEEEKKEKKECKCCCHAYEGKPPTKQQVDLQRMVNQIFHALDDHEVHYQRDITDLYIPINMTTEALLAWAREGICTDSRALFDAITEMERAPSQETIKAYTHISNLLPCMSVYEHVYQTIAFTPRYYALPPPPPASAPAAPETTAGGAPSLSRADVLEMIREMLEKEGLA
jgi:hypothetical protein